MRGVTPNKLDGLSAVFKQDELEWRLQQAQTGNNGIWGRALVYVTNRAIMDRLDKVVGPENWKNEFRPAPNGEGALLCGIGILVAGDADTPSEWITKWDGAENTATEPVKGGLSASMKRAAVQWGIGRYLYYIENDYIQVTDDGRFYGKTKEKDDFRWNPPTLPEWAILEDDKDALTTNIARIKELARIIPANSKARINKKDRNIIEFNRDNWGTILKDPILAAEVVAAMEKASKN
jgi:hypothetical protein